MLRQQLGQKLQQKLSPQQILAMKLLEIPTLELEERIRQELEENPALEEGREEMPPDTEDTDFDNDYNEGGNDFDLDEYMPDDDIPDYKLQINNASKEDKHTDIPFVHKETFSDYLLNQLSLQNLSEQDAQIAEYIVGNIDDEGYLRRSLEAISDDLIFQTGIDVDAAYLETILRIIQAFEPAGVAARDLRECLLLQIQRKEKNQNQRLAEKIIRNYFDEFTRKRYEKIIHQLTISENEFKQANAEIMKLNPKPGNGWGGATDSSSQHIVPDFILEVENDKPRVLLNNYNVPELRVSYEYQELFADYSAAKSNSRQMKETVSFVKQKLDAAKWFIEAIKQRNDRLLMTVNAIVKFQKDFFLHGDASNLRPMILKDIAQLAGLDISTVSRVSNSKYIQTDFGVFPLKYFFSEGMQTETGEEVSTREIKKILEECIAAEDKRNPVADEKLCELLNEKGYKIARRTVAKYREQLNIPVSRLRKGF